MKFQSRKPRLKQKKGQKLSFKQEPQIQSEKMLYSEDRIKNTPILNKMMTEMYASLKKHQEQYERELNRSGLSRAQIEKLLNNHQLQKRMTIKMFQQACDKSETPIEMNRQPQMSEGEQVMVQASAQQHLIEVQPAQNSQEVLNYLYEGPLEPQAEQSTFSELQIPCQKRTEPEIKAFCEANNLYYKLFKVQRQKVPIFGQNHQGIFHALIQHYYLLTNWFASHREELTRVVRHYEIEWISQDDYSSFHGEHSWIDKYKQRFAIIMERGENYKEKAELAPPAQQERFRIRYYLQRPDAGDVLDYLSEVAEGLLELLKIKIYHMDVQSHNFIPVCSAKGTIFKFIDFQLALYLGNDPYLRQNVKKIWQLLKYNFTRGVKGVRGDLIVEDVFTYILCREYEFAVLQDNRLKLGKEFFEKILACEDQTAFIDYLKNYSRVYYRIRFMDIWDEISSGIPHIHAKNIQKIIKTSQFENMVSEFRQLKQD